MTQGRDLPWLQDTDADQNGQSDVWEDQWKVVFRDVIIVDSNNIQIGVYNLTENNLAVTENYELLKETLLKLARSQPVWQNSTDPRDVNNDGQITPIGDVLPCINEINQPLISNELAHLPLPSTPEWFYDVNGDNKITPIGDVLPLINFINGESTGEAEFAGEGEAELTLEISPRGQAQVSAKADSHPPDVESTTNGGPDPRVFPMVIDQPQSAELYRERDLVFADTRLDFLADPHEDSLSKPWFE